MGVHRVPKPQLLVAISSARSVDGKDRVRDFLARYGGAALVVEHEGDRSAERTSGWSEVHAADGYRLRCERYAFGGGRQMNSVEIAHGSLVTRDARCD
jgi:hypothetical protein